MHTAFTHSMPTHAEGLVQSVLVAQQREMGPRVHTCIARLQLSEVQASLSLQSAVALQQPATAA